jgi:hypothetical protein
LRNKVSCSVILDIEGHPDLLPYKNIHKVIYGYPNPCKGRDTSFEHRDLGAAVIIVLYLGASVLEKLRVGRKARLLGGGLIQGLMNLPCNATVLAALQVRPPRGVHDGRVATVRNLASTRLRNRRLRAVRRLPGLGHNENSR